MILMRKSGKIACGALAVTVLCGILGLIGLVVFGVDIITQTDTVLPEPGDLMPAFYALLTVMAGSMIVMIAALARKK